MNATISQEAVLYARVSSKEQEQEGYSIPAQLKLLKEYAQKNDLSIIKEFVEVETAKRSGRAAFEKMLDFFQRNRNVRNILVEKTDRLYRNFKDYVSVEDLMQQGLAIHLVKEGDILHKDSKSHQKFIHGIKVLLAKNYIDNLSEEVKKGLVEKASQGIYPSMAPLGYRNNKVEKIIEINPEAAPIVKRLYEWYATGQYSLRQVRKLAEGEGLLRPDSKRPLFTSEIATILKNPIYHGEFRWNGNLYPGVHEPIITKSLFDQAQEVFRRANRPYYTSKDFVFRGLLICGHCGCQITAEIQKGKYIYYRCTNGKGKCPQLYLREEVLDDLLAEQVVKAIRLTTEDVELMREGLRESLKDQSSFHKDRLVQLRTESDRLHRRLEQVYQDRIDGKVTEEFWRQMTDRWQKKQEEVQEAITQHERASVFYFEEGVLLLELAQQAYSVYKAASLQKKRRILYFLLLNCLLKDRNLVPHYRKPFCWFAEGVKTEDWLPRMDSNHDKQIQNLLCYRYTTGQ